MNAVNTQEDEDGYAVYPSCSIIEIKTGDILQGPRVAEEKLKPVSKDKIIYRFDLTSFTEPKD